MDRKKKYASKYVPKSLSESDKKKQIKSIESKTIKPRPKLKSYKSKPSQYTLAFNKKYGEKLKNMKGGKSKSNISKVTGIPKKALDEVYDRGLGAYKSGSRPNVTANQWAMARVYSYIMGGKTRQVDKAITKKYNVKFRD
jgi:hypothetical protein